MMDFWSWAKVVATGLAMGLASLVTITANYD